MSAIPVFDPSQIPEPEQMALRGVLGYLNFSSGRFDPRLHQNLNRLYGSFGDAGERRLAVAAQLAQFLEGEQQSNPTFSHADQAREVIPLAFDELPRAYSEFHRDLLFHVSPALYDNPFFLGRCCEAVLAQGAPFNERDRVIRGALQQLNDFVGHRPVAVLESGQEMQPYPHERFRPVPLYLAEVGVACGPLQELFERAIQHLERAPEDILRGAHFHLQEMQELALDPRAYDHVHPMYKRTNYLFGEWDPTLIDHRGMYRRFVLRSIVVEALNDWIAQEERKRPREEVLFEASAVLCGTILMASTISGSGPNTYDSTVNLGSLLPQVAHRRDEFYRRLLESLEGEAAVRMRKAAEKSKQPFGHVRQHMNLYIAHRGAKQVQYSHLAYLYARMGYPEPSRARAALIPVLSVRFESEIECRLAAGHIALDRRQIQVAVQITEELEDLFNRGVQCGAFVDPWNILGFHGNFPLFHTREDAIEDARVERLLEVVEQIFSYNSRVLSEGAAEGEQTLRARVSDRFKGLAEQWDRYATSTVSGLPVVNGMESWRSARVVEQALEAWYAAGEAAGDISFWRERVEEFDSVKAYALTLDTLLRRADRVAALGLLMQWLSQAETVGLESGPFSFFRQINGLLSLLIESNESLKDAAVFWKSDWPMMVKLFDYLEVNAGVFWEVPQLTSLADEIVESERSETDEQSSDEEDESHGLYGAAYDGMVFRDSTQDGNEADTVGPRGTQYDTQMDVLQLMLEPRLRFLENVAQMWERTVVRVLMTRSALPAENEADPANPTVVLRRWYARIEQVLQELNELNSQLMAIQIPAPNGDPDSLAEYDRLLQLKFHLMNGVVMTELKHQEAAWQILSCITPGEFPQSLQLWERLSLEIYQALLKGDAAGVRQRLAPYLAALADMPLLYAPLDRGGDPHQLLLTRRLQASILLLLTQLPRMGFFRESWHLLDTVQQMEFRSPREGTVITEFDRLFSTGLRTSLECLIAMSESWKIPDPSQDSIIEKIGLVTDRYLELWLGHSGTMRLSSVEGLTHEPTWRKVVAFIERYGRDFFHSQMLSFGNLRAILHNGVGNFLEYLEQNEDPLHPIALLQETDPVVRSDAVEALELIFQITVEKYDRFLEYNTTTTHSDYGNQFQKFLDFLRIEASYERQIWNLSPLIIAHQVLVRRERNREADLWCATYASRTQYLATDHLRRLKRLENRYGMQLPGIRDQLEERFLKPLYLDRILALVSRAMQQARDTQSLHPAFDELDERIAEYTSTMRGAGVEVPAWLRALEREVEDWEGVEPDDNPMELELGFAVPLVPLTLKELEKQLVEWDKKPRKPRKRKSDP